MSFQSCEITISGRNDLATPPSDDAPDWAIEKSPFVYY